MAVAGGWPVAAPVTAMSVGYEFNYRCNQKTLASPGINTGNATYLLVVLGFKKRTSAFYGGIYSCLYAFTDYQMG